MNKVAKLIIVDGDNKYLMMRRSGHPVFGNDPDLPGGTLEDGEVPLKTMIREVYEEAGIVVDAADTRLLYEGTTYSLHKTHYSLYIVTLLQRPAVVMSWEHSSYEWLTLEVFLEQAKTANDTYMQMVYHTLEDI